MAKRSAYGKHCPSSRTGMTRRRSTRAAACSSKYRCPRVKGLAFITTTPVVRRAVGAVHGISLSRHELRYRSSPRPFSIRIASGARAITWKPRLSKIPWFSGLVNSFSSVIPREAAWEMRWDTSGATKPSLRASEATAINLIRSPDMPAPARIRPSASSITKYESSASRRSPFSPRKRSTTLWK